MQNNIFFCTNAAPWFTFFVLKPFGPGHFIHGLTVTGNAFKSVNGGIDRAEQVDLEPFCARARAVAGT